MTRSVRRITIVGGGIAGLALAAALDPQRFEVALVEAQPQRTTGAALGLWPSARLALTALGVTLPPHVVDATVTVHRLDGRQVAHLPTPAVAQMSRPLLVQALDAAVPSSVQRVEAEVEEPRTCDGDLVVGADGVRSRVRPLVVGHAAERIETPWVTLRGMASSDAEAQDLAAGGPREFWGRGVLFGDAPVVGGRYWFTAHRSALGPEPLDAAAVLREFRDRCGQLAPSVEALLDAPGSEIIATRLWTTPALARYRRGRYVVIGDAAHAATPNLARGATDAILDAVSLARALNSGGSLAAWEVRRLPTTQAARVIAGGATRLVTRTGPSTAWRRFT